MSVSSYAGTRVTEAGWKPPRVPLHRAQNDPQWFYANFVAKRLPCILFDDTLADGAAEVGDKRPRQDATCEWFEQIRKTCGNLQVLRESPAANERTLQLEQRSDTDERFGLGRKVASRISLNDFLDIMEGRLNAHSELTRSNIYMTTQYEDEEEDDDDDIDDEACLMRNPFMPPLLAIQDKLPARPPIIGKLVPWSINLWCGYAPMSSRPSSSGLHHDAHDNLFILLHGKKTFALLSPERVLEVLMYGSVEHVMPNGRIVYKSASHIQVRQDGMDRKTELRLLLQHWQSQLDVLCDSNDADAIQKIEDALDETLDQLASLDQGLGDESQHSGDGESSVTSPRRPEKAESPHPDSFARENFEELLKRSPGVHWGQAELQAKRNEILYLPAGWMHEVSSSGGLHLAVNYWFHPPVFGAPFDRPYGDSNVSFEMILPESMRQ
ncbi:JmjC domain-containing protein 4 [Porphyridium purpureum]|uniref:JmjC domain-containing protein 4 n=1 Tax=Porphyridium purpureum TaxID=35688 RepID=A0A5J4YWC5_PORPP|nr:JmjC domain-containing protein 4 [Porphyridium purpureum]|eukprot:POR8346..scf209_3